MKKRVLMSSVAASVLAGMFMLSGCGSSSSTVAEVPESSNPATQTPTQKPETAVEKPALEPRCATLQYVGEVSNVEVQALDEDGNVIGRTTTKSNGEYCFNGDIDPFKVQAKSKGIDSRLDKDVSCAQEALSFIENEVTDCYPISNFDEFSSPLHSLARAKQFRSFMGDVYEEMDIDFDVYDSAILKALTKSSIIDIQDTLIAVTVKSDKVGHDADQNLSVAQKDIIGHIVDIATSSASEDTVSLAMYSFLASSAQIKSDETNATRKALFYGDNGVTQWINENRLIVERYINENTPEDEKNRAVVVAAEKAGINLKIFASYLVSSIDGGVLKKSDGTPATLDLAGLEEVIPPASLGEHYLKTTYIACGPLAELMTAEADYNKTRMYFDDISNINCSTGCKTVYANHKDGNESKPVTTELVMQTKGIFFNEKGLKLKIADQYSHIKEYAGHLFNLNLAFDVNNTGMTSAESDLLATIVIDVPNACDSDDKSKDEYIALSFTVRPTGFNAGEGKDGTFVIPADTNITFSSKIKTVTLVGDKNVTSYDNPMKATLVNAVADNTFEVKDGVMNLNLIKLLDTIISKAGTSVGNIQDLIVRAVSNVDGDPALMKASISLLDIAKATSAIDETPTDAQKAEKKAANFITNASTIDPHAYNLDDLPAYKAIFDNMDSADATVNAVTIKTCFSGRDDD